MSLERICALCARAFTPKQPTQRACLRCLLRGVDAPRATEKEWVSPLRDDEDEEEDEEEEE